MTAETARTSDEWNGYFVNKTRTLTDQRETAQLNVETKGETKPKFLR